MGYLLTFILGIAVGTPVGMLLWSFLQRGQNDTSKLEKRMQQAFGYLARKELRDNAKTFLERTAEQLQPLDKNLTELDQRIRELEQKREGAYQGLRVQLQQLAQTESALQATTTTLSEALRSSSQRGRWGEIQLRRVVEMSGMVEHVDYEEQVHTSNGRPDMVVRLPDGGSIPVDAKASMNAYLDAQGSSQPDATLKLEQHAQAVRGRVRELSRKAYWEQFEKTPQFVVMFIPNEASLSAAFRADGELLEYALQSKVLIASPVTLLALLKSVSFGWQQVSLADNARRIAEEGKTLYSRLSKIAEYITEVGDNLERSVSAYNNLVGSFERRLLPSARKFEELQVEKESLPAVKPMDVSTRTLRADELSEKDYETT